MIVRRFKVNMVPGGRAEVVNLSQYDSDVVLEFELYTTEGVFTVAEGTTVLFRGSKPDGNGISIDAELESTVNTETGQTVHVVTVELNQQVTAAAGRSFYELSLRKDGEELNTANIIFDIERAPLDKDTPPSNSVIREIIDTIDRTDEFLGAARSIAADREIVEQKTENAEAAAASAEDALEQVNTKAQQIIRVTTSAEEIATEALSTANNAQNHMADLDSQMQEVKTALNNVSIDPDDLGLYQDEDTMYVYPTYKGVRSENGIPLASKGGGGGGGEVINAKLTVENTTGWLSKTIATGSSVSVSLRWSSIADGMETGRGNVRIMVNDIVRASWEIDQGNVSIDLTPYLSTGTNKVKVRISDTYDQGSTTTFNITAIALSISSTFDTSTPYTSTFTFPYTPVGSVEKTVHVLVDGTEVGTMVTPVSGRQMTMGIPPQSHGAHSLTAYFTAVINNETVRSNELYYEFIFLEQLNNTPVITSPFKSGQTVDQFASVPIAFTVYDPAAATAEVKIYVNNALVSTQTVPRTEQSYTVRANTAGAYTIKLVCGRTEKTITFTATESQIDVKPETDSLVLYLSAEGRSNNSADRAIWDYEDISACLNNFNWTSDGWQQDEDGVTCLRIMGNARVTIPYKLFGADFRQGGKTIEIEFATQAVMDYDAVIMSCMNAGRGFSMTAQRAQLTSEQSTISTQYKDNEHIRLAFTVEKTAENRLIMVYIDGIPVGAVQYPVDDDFQQTTPADITIGSNDCTTDIYCIRVYDNDLTGNQILDNWIADTQDGALMLERYTRNQVYDASTNISPANLPSDLPYFILDAPELPQYKGDKKTITGQYIDRMYPSKSFNFGNCQINVQGTSSAPYARKNYDMQFKGGFDLGATHADNYTLMDGIIPFNRFVLKADVASNEGINNVGLVMLYNDVCPYKTPEMKADSRVRWGIAGKPIVVFWHDTTTGEVKFLGKYNFNLPKRAPAPYGYNPNSDDPAIAAMESWEYQNNVSLLMKFQSDYFNEEMRTDPDTGETKEAWRFDYEARFPSDEWTNYAALQEFQSFVYSTWRDQATGDALTEPVTYEGVEYTSDTAAYRLAKFRAEFPTYAQLDTFLFYYIFTEFFLMVDSRAKNLFIGFNGDPVTVAGRVATRKATAQPYDMDTAMGTNNEGSLTYGYSYEDTDHIGTADIFNAQDSVLWNNIRDGYPMEVRQMYQTLRTGGILDSDVIEERFEAHQSKWPEAVWIEDARYKYLEPLTNPDPGKQATAMYLPMLQGPKKQQRKWWLPNREKFMDSKWHAGKALLSPIQLRAYSKGNVTVTPYFDIYPSVRYASHTVTERGKAGVATTLICPNEIPTFNDTEVYVYSAPQIAKVGDLSPLKIGLADFSGAINLQEVKIGSADSGYDNTNLYQLSFGANTLLKNIDVRNCSGLGDTTIQGHSQQTVDISNCTMIEEVYFEGTNVTAVTLPNGGNLKVLHLPETITNLTVLNQTGITDFVIGSYANITTLRLENTNLDMLSILRNINAGARIRLVGFDWRLTDAAEIEGVLAILDTMRGLDANGNNVEVKEAVIGKISTEALTGAQIASYQARYPYIEVTADHTTAQLYFYNGSTLISGATQTVLDGGNGTYMGTTPTKASDAQYTYTFAGWSKGTDDNTVDDDALQHVVEDRNVYACFTGTLRKYSVTFVKASADGGGTLQTIQNVNYGTVITAANAYTGATPTTSQGSAEDYPFEGWSPASATVRGNTTFTAVFGSPVEVVEITDSWDTIITKVANGTANYKIGNYKPLDLGTEGVVNMQIVGKNASPLASGSGTATYDLLSMELLATSHRMNPSRSGSSGNYTEGTGTIGGFEKCEMRTYLKETIKPLIPETVRNAIKPVTKYSSIYNTAGTYVNNVESTEDLWLPSMREMNFSGYETQGPRYSDIFPNNASRVKMKVGASSASWWWLRSAGNGNAFSNVHSSGTLSNNGASTVGALALGFSI